MNSTVELIRAITFCGKGPLMTDSAKTLQQVTTNKTIPQSLMAQHVLRQRNNRQKLTLKTHREGFVLLPRGRSS